MRTLQPFSGKVKQTEQNYLNQKLVIGSFKENVFVLALNSENECSEHLKRSFFSYFFEFFVRKLEPLSGKLGQSIQNYLNQNLVIGSFLGNGFTGNFI